MTMNIKKIIKEEISKTNYKSCSNFSDPEARKLCQKISSLTSWLHKGSGLGLMGVVDEMLKDLKIVQDMTEKYQEPLKLLYDTGKFEKIKLENGIYTHERLLASGLVVGEDGEYDYVNKLNTNYRDLAELITDLLVKGGQLNKLVDKELIGIKKYLENIKPNLLRLLNKYYTPEDLKQFTRNTIGLTKVGDVAEDYVCGVLEKFGMKKLYQGGNGDFIDMLFGVDLIMEHKGRTITCQVKNRETQTINASKSSQYINIDYFMSPTNDNGIIVYNRMGTKNFMLDGNGKIK